MLTIIKGTKGFVKEVGKGTKGFVKEVGKGAEEFGKIGVKVGEKIFGTAGLLNAWNKNSNSENFEDEPITADGENHDAASNVKRLS